VGGGGVVGGGVVGGGVVEGGVVAGGGVTVARQRAGALRLLHFFFVFAACRPRFFLADTDSCGTAKLTASALPANSRTVPMTLLALML
jgi:hypothetical protein